MEKKLGVLEPITVHEEAYEILITDPMEKLMKKSECHYHHSQLTQKWTSGGGFNCGLFLLFFCFGIPPFLPVPAGISHAIAARLGLEHNSRNPHKSPFTFAAITNTSFLIFFGGSSSSMQCSWIL